MTNGAFTGSVLNLKVFSFMFCIVGLGRKNKKSAIVAPQASHSSKGKKRSPSTSTVTASPPQSLPSSLPNVAPPGSPDTMSLMSSCGSNVDSGNLNDSEDCTITSCDDAVSTIYIKIKYNTPS